MIPGRAVIYVATGTVDMRRSFDGLAEVVRQVLQKDPLSGALFLFVNRPSNRLKLIWWDKSGYCILYKRLERGTFAVPKAEPGATSVPIAPAELVKLLEGLPAERAQHPPSRIER